MMRIPVTIIVVFLLLSGSSLTQQPRAEDSACRFTVEGESTGPTVMGPEDLVALVYAVDQPDSPIEITSVDLEGMWLSISREQLTHRDCAKYKVRNRSNRTVQSFSIQLQIQTLDGAGDPGTSSSVPLAPGETAELGSCGGGGYGGAPHDKVKLLVSIRVVNFGDCLYRPSERIPTSLGVPPPW